MNTINWKTTPDDHALIRRAIDRAESLKLVPGRDMGTLMMDLTACHLNGCALDLRRLVENFPDFDFAHDVCGIFRHIDRSSGKLTDCFLPRCARPDESIPDCPDDSTPCPSCGRTDCDSPYMTGCGS